MLAFEGATAKSPILKMASFSKIDFQLNPLLTVFQSPPDPNPTYIVPGLSLSTCTTSALALLSVGPKGTQLNLKVLFSFISLKA